MISIYFLIAVLSLACVGGLVLMIAEMAGKRSAGKRRPLVALYLFLSALAAGWSIADVAMGSEVYADPLNCSQVNVQSLFEACPKHHP